ncbi:transmembrane protein [Cystoisospora suis]|uniref:Transmembrane protein n=1 Tax=Cystoisospora suis TaxID=483139 RepID=A0A2C6KTS4_9APIC|nr:transmembrane protein [Cystoisospora suis]
MKVLLPGALCLLYGCVFAFAEPDVNCEGAYGPWSVCEPLEGHATHHDSEDEFDLDRGPDGNFTRDCFHFQTYRIVTPKSGNGRECSHKEGSKRFKYCEDCSQIPSVHKRLEAQQATDSLRTFTIIAGVFCLFAMAALTALCVRKVMKDSSARPEQITMYAPGPHDMGAHPSYVAGARASQVPAGVPIAPEYPQHTGKTMTPETDRNTEAGECMYRA